MSPQYLTSKLIRKTRFVNIILFLFTTFLLFSLLYIISSSTSFFFTSSLSLLTTSNFDFCTTNYTNYCPCHDPKIQKRFKNTNHFRKERHCPNTNERLKCLIPIPKGYKTPFHWPKSKDNAWFRNVPFTKLLQYKKSQNWVRLEGQKLVFPGGGTSFPDGVKGYVDALNKVLPLTFKSGLIRTVLDVGCGVASFGAYLMDYEILTMSIAPSDEHEAQVQFALERGLPAMLGVLSTHRLPFPSKSFDMAHCSRCLVPWTANDGLYLREIDRIMRPGGYWVLSGPPINWRVNYEAWKIDPKVLEKEQNMLEELAMQLCWEKVAEGEQIAVWKKPTNHISCTQKSKTLRSPKFCNSSDPDNGWYTKMSACIFPLPEVKDINEVSGGALEKWPIRLNSPPPRVRNENNNDGFTLKTYIEDTRTWERRVSYYDTMLKSLSSGKYRNVMDMNAGFGGFAAAMVKYPVWVMNVVPFDAKSNNLGVIFERGLIGTYMDWCEPFSTYPRTYDLIHAHGIFSMYINKCDITDILVEMHRILRPKGSVIIRDNGDIILKVKEIIDKIRWKGTLVGNGTFDPQMILLVHNKE
ncbi:putative S-adenosyl-L-methionine-dependent methyltransferase [Lupinus albus]|uniref:Methyltransferase n=1 Tax=Lupinus albus TaxID=3870 RepID=A0A6A4PT70_LUPAL|nr:putative S-adenosyl-L-methionine-dependent methyltransferase [Lupinus albus]